jgi:diguanylate cyclase (GGDEF)-like protein
MEIHSGLDSDKIIGKPLLDVFPNLNNRKFLRNCKAVFSFGNLCFFSQKLHKYMFPFKSTNYTGHEFEYMQQSCAMGPLRDENNEVSHLYIYVHDVSEVAVYERRLLDLNNLDPLTGIYNRRFLESRLKDEFNRFKRYGGNFSLIMMDIDHFKQVNDEYGHQCGDFILKSISSRICSLIRNVDYLARYGGEEFCCLLPETRLDAALAVAERFRTDIMSHENNFDTNIIKITISLGVSALEPGIESADMLFKKADDALYRAKEQGRNRVAIMSLVRD